MQECRLWREPQSTVPGGGPSRRRPYLGSPEDASGKWVSGRACSQPAGGREFLKAFGFFLLLKFRILLFTHLSLSLRLSSLPSLLSPSSLFPFTLSPSKEK